MAKKKKNNQKFKKNNYPNLGSRQVIPPNINSSIKKYWLQRYSLFSKFDQGIQLNQELWYSVTPESLGLFISKFTKCCLPEAKIGLNVFSGAGGSSIQLSKNFEKIVGIEYNLDNLKCSENNAEVYQRDNIEFNHEDVLNLFNNVDNKLDNFKEKYPKIDFIFASPPWGGVDYTANNKFDLNSLQPLNLLNLVKFCLKFTSNLVFFLPRNSNLIQLNKVTKLIFGDDAKVRVVYMRLKGHLKGILACWGDCFQMDENQIERSSTESNDDAFGTAEVDESDSLKASQKEKEKVNDEMIEENYTIYDSVDEDMLDY